MAYALLVIALLAFALCLWPASRQHVVDWARVFWVCRASTASAGLGLALFAFAPPEAHLRHLLRAYASYYNATRTHRSLDKGRTCTSPGSASWWLAITPDPRRTPSPVRPDLVFGTHKYGSSESFPRYFST